MNRDDEPVNLASKAFETPDHRNHILEHMHEIAKAINEMENKSNQLLEDANLSQRDSENIAEKIDEEIHSLQYQLDHCRRLVQGSETEILGMSFIPH